MFGALPAVQRGPFGAGSPAAAARSGGLFRTAPPPPPPAASPRGAAPLWDNSVPIPSQFRPNSSPPSCSAFAFSSPLLWQGSRRCPRSSAPSRTTQPRPCSEAQRSRSAAAAGQGFAATHAINMEVTCSAPRTADKKRCQTGSGCQQRWLGWICGLKPSWSNAAPTHSAHGAPRFIESKLAVVQHREGAAFARCFVLSVLSSVPGLPRGPCWNRRSCCAQTGADIAFHPGAFHTSAPLSTPSFPAVTHKADVAPPPPRRICISNGEKFCFFSFWTNKVSLPRPGFSSGCVLMVMQASVRREKNKIKYKKTPHV